MGQFTGQDIFQWKQCKNNIKNSLYILKIFLMLRSKYIVLGLLGNFGIIFILSIIYFLNNEVIQIGLGLLSLFGEIFICFFVTQMVVSEVKFAHIKEKQYQIFLKIVNKNSLNFINQHWNLSLHKMTGALNYEGLLTYYENMDDKVLNDEGDKYLKRTCKIGSFKNMGLLELKKRTLVQIK